MHTKQLVDMTHGNITRLLIQFAIPIQTTLNLCLHLQGLRVMAAVEELAGMLAA